MGEERSGCSRMRIGLIDVDGHNFPNIPLMKLAAWHKQHGDTVEWYEPLFSGHMDRVYMSKVFGFTEDYILRRLLTLRKRQRSTKTFFHTELETRSRLCRRKPEQKKNRELSKLRNIRKHRKRIRLRFQTHEKHLRIFKKKQRQQLRRRQFPSPTAIQKRCLYIGGI